jgi:hypothetical protein
MPVALSAKFTNWVSLPLDKALPEDQRPAFEVRFVNELQERSLETALDSKQGDTWGTYSARIRKELLPLIVSVRNFPDPQPASPDDILATLVRPELRDLADEILRATTLGYDEIKKSKLQQPSVAG